MTDLLYSDVEEQLRASVRAVLRDHDPRPGLLADPQGAATAPAAQQLWRRIGTDLGCAGLAIADRHGGAAASWREVAVVAEELGAAVAPVPFLGSAVVATATLLSCGGPGEELVAALASGQRTAALAVPFATAPTLPGGAPTVTVKAHDGALSGTVTGVADARLADVLLVPTEDGLYAVPATAAARTEVTTLDVSRPLTDLVLTQAPGRLLAGGVAAHDAVRAGLTAGAVMLAAEAVGVAGWCLETTVAYLKTRVQFARPVGSFQALKHRLADVWIELTQARAASRYAADCLARADPDLAVAAALAKAFCGPAAVLAAQECVQLHGGIGFTWEHPAHLYLKRAKSLSIGYGTADRHRAALASLVDLPPA